MSHVHNEDLFENTKMSFGEHLEELRTCLVRALLGLAIGFLIGLFVAGGVVRQIEGPLQRALEKFHFEKTKQELGAMPPSLEEFVRREGFVFQDVYWEQEELQRLMDLLEGKSEVPSAEMAPPTTSRPVSKSVDRPSGDADEVSERGAEYGNIVVGTPGPPSPRLIKTRIWRPLGAGVTSLSAHEPFMIYVKAAIITGAILTSPWIFWQIWSFVAAGLYPHEKGYVYFFLPFSLSLFFAGAALAFFFVFDPVLDFLFQFNRMMNIDPDPRISEWMGFVLVLPLGFGISFQLPLVMLILERIGIVTLASYLDKWRIAVLGIFVLSMLLTPADPISMLLMAVPLTFLYFGGILLCRYLPARHNPYGPGYDV